MSKEIDRQQLLGKLDQLEEKFADPAYPQDLETIAEWRSSVKRAMITENLKEHEGIKMIVKVITDDLEEIKFVLLNKAGLTETSRDIILTKKKMYEYFLSLIIPSKQDLDSILKEVEDNLKDDN